MITAKIWKPKTGLRPASHRRASAALGLALAAALRRAGNFDAAEAEAWKGVPDAVKETFTVDIKHVDEEAIKTVAERLSRHSGVTIKMQGRLGRAELAVDIDIYAHEYVPVLAGILHEPAEVLAEPRGRVDGRPIASFYQLFDEEYEAMKTLAVELFAELHMAELRVATGAGVRTHPLWRLAARIHATQEHSDRYAIPLWHRPWTWQVARSLYALAPPELRRLAGPAGLRRAIRENAKLLRKYLERHYIVAVRHTENAIQLIPKPSSPPTQTHRKAMKTLAEALTNAMRRAAGEKALETIQQRGYLDWHTYVEALQQELAQELKRYT
ncbi:hypothetical protein PYWP30_01185 [Pyrobaculum sp. WP30]|nr:hypothetical protein PYWP30_01185 [Pyrobaculum sp. WP30]